MPKVSVLMPVYNTKEEYLRAAIESILAQTFTDFELIIVNDGSTNNAAAVLTEYAAKDKRIQVINQKNSGVSAARNAGMKAATGKYISFIDSDDYLAADTLKKALSAEVYEADIILFGSYTEKRGKLKTMWDNELLRKFALKAPESRFSADKIRIFSNVWAKLYKRSFLEKNKIFFPESVRTAEDAVFNIQVLYCSPKCLFLPECLYYYRISDSQSLSRRTECISSDMEAFRYLERQDYFQQTRPEEKLIIIEKFINGLLFHLHHIKRRKKTADGKIDEFIDYLSSRYGDEKIAAIMQNKKYRFSWREKLFCRYDSPTRKYRIYRICGIKFKIRRSDYEK